MKPLTLYLRREPTTDETLLKYAPEARRLDVVAYADRKATKTKGRWTWFSNNQPTRRNKHVMLNCYRWLAVWLFDKPVPHDSVGGPLAAYYPRP